VVDDSKQKRAEEKRNLLMLFLKKLQSRKDFSFGEKDKKGR
jgi:hypothetical protein